MHTSRWYLSIPAWARYALAPLTTSLAAAIQYSLLPEPGIAPFVFFFSAVALTAWLGGTAPGLLAVVLSASVANVMFVVPKGRLSTSEPALTATALFLISSSATALLCAGFRKAALGIVRAADRLRRQGELLDLSQDAILVWTANDGIEEWNGGAQALYGYTAAEALGRSPHDLLKTESPRPLPEITAEVRRVGYWEGELRHRGRTGNQIWVWSQLKFIRGSDGVERILEANRDLTQRKFAEDELRRLVLDVEAERRRLVTILERVPIGIGVVEASAGSLAFSNPRLHQLVGLAGSGKIGWNSSRCDGPSVDSSGTAVARALHGELVHEEVMVVSHATDETLVLLVDGAPIRTAGGSVSGAVLALQDVTDRKRAEEDLRAAKAELEEVDRRKDEFLGVLSHELRNPLTPIRTSVFLLNRSGGLDERGRKAVAVIERQERHLSRLIDDLLDVTRIARGKIRLQRARVDLGDLVRRVVEDHRTTLVTNGLGVDLEIDPYPAWVDADPARVEQVIGNLLQNSSKFTPSGGRVVVSLFRDDRGMAAIEVRDTGIGLDDATLARIFQPFTQADRSLDRSRGGLGLGLALSKGLVELHGGTIQAASDGPGCGARFIVRLPLSGPAAAAAVEVAHGQLESCTLRPRRLLVIEDNVDAAASLKDLLEIEGHRVTVAHDGREGVNEALRSTPEVVVCDIGLPGLDGYGVARLLRQDPRTSSVLLVALSGYAQPEDVRRAAEAGFDRHLAKPPDLAELTRILADCPSHSAHDSPGAPRPGPAAEHRAPDSDGVCKVLLVDDDAVLRDTLATVLRGEGFEVIEARNGHECLELIERGLEFNATLLDYRMPGMNGGQVFERLKAKGLGDAVILMTAASAAPEIAREHGFRQFVPKPFGMEDLLTVLGQIVSGSGCRSSEV